MPTEFKLLYWRNLPVYTQSKPITTERYMRFWSSIDWSDKDKHYVSVWKAYEIAKQYGV
jgi:hypothetical protein